MWKKYFKFIKLKPGTVIVPGFGKIDFSRNDIPLETIKKLWEDDFEYLEITPEGLELYNKEASAEKEQELELIRKKYKEVVGKEVAKSYKNNVTWMQQKIDKTQVES